MSRASNAREERPEVHGLPKRGFFDSWERKILGVPAPIMMPRLVFIGAAVALVAFGLVMVFSASSIKGLLSDSQDPSSFFTKQVLAMVPGIVLLLYTALQDYHAWSGDTLQFKGIMVISFGLLLAVKALGLASHGAMRWIPLGPLTLQPSELVKASVIVATANLCWRHFQNGEWDGRKFVALLFGVVGSMLGLIFLQPDKGTTLVLGLTVIVMLRVAGANRRVLLYFLAGAALVFLASSLADDYSRQRLFTMINPEADAYDSGYQLTQGFYAFGSGGLFGLGLGMGRQKYSYLPEMHNDFIFAVVGEELGAVGCIALLALFAVLFWAALKIAEQAPDLLGRLIAMGCAFLIAFSVLLNVCGVLATFPMSGKTIPFISYGGSAMMGALLLVGMVVSVSRASDLPETDADRARSGISLAGNGADGRREGLALVQTGAFRRRDVGREEATGVGQATPRSFRLVEGGADKRSAHGRDDAPREARRGTSRTERRGGTDQRRGRGQERGGLSAHPEARVTRDASGRERIDLGRSSADRLRPQSGPVVRERGGDAGRSRRR